MIWVINLFVNITCYLNNTYNVYPLCTRKRSTCLFESSLIWIKHMPLLFGAEPCQPQEGSRKEIPLSTKMFNPAIYYEFTDRKLHISKSLNIK